MRHTAYCKAGLIFFLKLLLTVYPNCTYNANEKRVYEKIIMRVYVYILQAKVARLFTTRLREIRSSEVLSTVQHQSLLQRQARVKKKGGKKEKKSRLEIELLKQRHFENFLTALIFNQPNLPAPRKACVYECFFPFLASLQNKRQTTTGGDQVQFNAT